MAEDDEDADVGEVVDVPEVEVVKEIPKLFPIHIKGLKKETKTICTFVCQTDYYYYY